MGARRQRLSRRASRVSGRVGAWLGKRPFGRALLGAAGGYTRHATSQLAAAVSFRMLFSLVPLVAFVVSVADILLPDKGRDAVARWLASVAPGRALDSSVEHALTSSRVPPTIAGLISLAFLLWAASGMMGSIRIAFRVIWENDLRRKYVQSKLLDFALVVGVGVRRSRVVRRHAAHTGACGDRPRSEPEGRRSDRRASCRSRCRGRSRQGR